MGLAKRELVEELMDDPGRTDAEVGRALEALATLNRITLSRRILASRVRGGTVLDVGTGGGDVPAYLVRRGLARSAVGLDVSPRVLGWARRREPSVGFVRGDGVRLPFADGAFDTAVCHLFLHHLEEEDAVELLREMARVAREVVVVDLLRRRRLRLWVWLLTRFWRSELIRRDGPASVRRAFRPREIRDLAERAGLDARLRVHCFHRFSLATGDAR